MRICPQCKGEFQDWVVSCLDCHINLIDDPTPDSKEPPIYWITEVHLRASEPTVGIGVLGFLAIAIGALVLIAGVSFGLYQLGKDEGHSKGLGQVSMIMNRLPHEHGPVFYWAEDEFKPIPAGALENQGNMTWDTKGGTTVTVPMVQIQQNVFATNDLARAQEHVPFTIMLPTYIPENSRGPDIQGPLDLSSSKEIKITVSYSVQYKGLIIIDESQSVPSKGALAKNDPNLERLEINGTEVIGDRVGNNFHFEFRGVSVYVHPQNMFGGTITDDELLKVVQSMVGRTN